MKTLNITMAIAADTYEEAELKGKLDLMEFVKTVGMRSLSSIGACEGETKSISDVMYEVNAKVQIDGTVNVNEIIQDVQKTWKTKPYIIYSSIFVSEEQKSEPVQKPRDYEPVTCIRCGQIMVKGYENVIKIEKDAERYLCERCFTDAVDSNVVVYCENCENNVYAECVTLNPVTGNRDLCPVCGNKMFD